MAKTKKFQFKEIIKTTPKGIYLLLAGDEKIWVQKSRIDLKDDHVLVTPKYAEEIDKKIEEYKQIKEAGGRQNLYVPLCEEFAWENEKSAAIDIRLYCLNRKIYTHRAFFPKSRIKKTEQGFATQEWLIDSAVNKMIEAILENCSAKTVNVLTNSGLAGWRVEAGDATNYIWDQLGCKLLAIRDTY